MKSQLLRAGATLPILMTMLPVSTVGRGWVRIWEFPRLQIAATGLLALGAMLRKSRGTLPDAAVTLGLAASVAYQLTKIFPYTPFSPKQVQVGVAADPERCLSLVTANVFMENRKSGRMMDIVREADPDVVCLLEPDHWWENEMRGLEDTHPHVIKCPQENTYGMLLYSRLPLEQCEIRFLVQDDVPSMRSVIRLPSGDEVVLYCVHPRPPRATRASYGRDAELVLIGREMASDQRPAIVLGDLNDVGWSYTTTLFQRLSHTLDPRVGRGMFNTFNANNPLLRYPLDHVFHTRHFSLIHLERLAHAGSDHFPMLVTLLMRAEPAPKTAAPHRTEADRANAKEMVGDAAEQGLID